VRLGSDTDPPRSGLKIGHCWFGLRTYESGADVAVAYSVADDGLLAAVEGALADCDCGGGEGEG
jgi:hypothetical protein